MTKYLLAGHFGPNDPYQPGPRDNVQTARLDLGPAPKRLAYGIGRAIADMRKMNVRPSEIGIDLLVLAVHVHAADIRLNRVVCAQDSWTREIMLSVPVSDPALWSGALPVLKTMLRFLTGDLWEIEFRPRPEQFRNLTQGELPGFDSRNFDGVCLYSGGLDSLIGAIDEIIDGRWPLFVSHAGEGAVSRPQANLFEDLRNALIRNTGANRQMERLRYAARFPKGLFQGVSSEDTTRGRSFLFLAIGAAAGTGLGRQFELRIPENGFIALNVPLDLTRLGSATTRTTHPFYIRRWNELLGLIGIPANVVNPYAGKTKGEMIADCAAPDVLRQFIAQSVSCAHPSTGRFARDHYSHCGICVPCLIRRAAILSAYRPDEDPTGYRCEDLSARPLDAAKAEGQQVRGYQYALARLQERPDLAAIFIHKPGPLLEDAENLTELTRVYTQGMSEVRRLLQGVETFSSKMPG
jgi:hypothetical protein